MPAATGQATPMDPRGRSSGSSRTEFGSISGPLHPGCRKRARSLDTDIPLEDLREVITDYEHFSEFFPHMESSVIEDADPTRPVVRQRLRFPLLLAAREYLIQVDMMSDANGDTKRDTKRDTGGEARQWLVSWRQIRLPQLPVDAVEPIDLHGSWRLSRKAAGTRIVYTVSASGW